MTSYTISGITSLPDDTDPLAGTWFVRVYASPPAAVDADGSVRAGVWSGSTDETGALSQSFPETTTGQLYEAWFQSADRKANLGRYQFALTANTTWGAIMTTPTIIPVEPTDVLLAQEAAQEAAGSATAAADSAVSAATSATDAEEFTRLMTSVALDIDGVPYFDPDGIALEDAIPVLVDTDGVPYIVTGP